MRSGAIVRSRVGRCSHFLLCGMPIVRSSANNVEHQAGLVLSGDIQHISGYAAEGYGEDVPLVFTEIKPIGKGTWIK